MADLRGSHFERPNWEPEEFRSRLRAAAKNAGGIDMITEVAGITPRTFARYLAGDTEPTVGKLIAIANAAGVSVDWLAAGRGPMRLSNRTAGELAGHVRRLGALGEAPAEPYVIGALGGRVIGAAHVCGVDNRRIVRATEMVFEAINRRARDRAEEGRATQLVAAGLEIGGKQVAARQVTCADALSSFDHLEQELLPRR